MTFGLLPYLPFADALGFVASSPGLVASLIGITALYVLGTELTKRVPYRTESQDLSKRVQ